jgi:hypothetical protein
MGSPTEMLLAQIRGQRQGSIDELAALDGQLGELSERRAVVARGLAELDRLLHVHDGAAAELRAAEAVEQAGGGEVFPS